jgi:hypothetical protein
MIITSGRPATNQRTILINSISEDSNRCEFLFRNLQSSDNPFIRACNKGDLVDLVKAISCTVVQAQGNWDEFVKCILQVSLEPLVGLFGCYKVQKYPHPSRVHVSLDNFKLSICTSSLSLML